MSAMAEAESGWLVDLTARQTGILHGESAAVLDRIREPGVGLCLWQRVAPAAFKSSLDALEFGNLPSGRVLAPRRHVEAAVASILGSTRLAGALLERFLVEDIATLATCFARIAATDLIDVRLEAVGHDACWKFHRDRSCLRLITTYRGAGTQIVPSANVDEALQAQRAYLGPIVQLPAFAVALLKGDQATEGTGVFHRSPPIAGTGTTRLVLCVDSPSVASPPIWKAGS